MIREYKILIDDALLHGHTPTEFRQPTRADCAVMNRHGGITIGDHFMENCGPRLILSPPEPEPVERPPTLADGWELVQVTKRAPDNKEWFVSEHPNHMGEIVQADHQYVCSKRWIVRRKPAPAPDPRESLALAIREALPKLETLCDLARKAVAK